MSGSVPWYCPACQVRVDAGHGACTRCGCPQDAGEDEIDAIRLRLAGVVHDATPGPDLGFSCAKCGGGHCERGQLRGSAGGLSAAFELSNLRFDFVSCRACGYTEFYRSDVSLLGQLGDLLVS